MDLNEIANSTRAAGDGDDGFSMRMQIESAWSRVTTPRLVLRRPRVEELQTYMKTYEESTRVLRRLRKTTMPAPTYPKLGQCREIWMSFVQHWDTYGFGLWAATFPDTDAVIAFGGLQHQLLGSIEVLNLRLGIAPEHRRQGYATEIARVAVDLGRAYLAEWPIILRVGYPDAAISVRVAEKVGLTRIPRPELESEHTVYTVGWPSANNDGSAEGGDA